MIVAVWIMSGLDRSALRGRVARTLWLYGPYVQSGSCRYFASYMSNLWAPGSTKFGSELRNHCDWVTKCAVEVATGRWDVIRLRDALERVLFRDVPLGHILLVYLTPPCRTDAPKNDT